LNLQAKHWRASKNQHQPAFNKKQSFVWTLACLLFLDTPMVVIFGTFMLLVWVHDVHDQYLIKQIEAACNVLLSTLYERDLTTTNLLDLYLSDDAAPQDANKHQLTHGFTMFPSILSQETISHESTKLCTVQELKVYRRREYLADSVEESLAF
jgi:hypothetical protein